jgi:hypothetical protein
MDPTKPILGMNYLILDLYGDMYPRSERAQPRQQQQMQPQNKYQYENKKNYSNSQNEISYSQLKVKTFDNLG